MNLVVFCRASTGGVLMILIVDFFFQNIDVDSTLGKMMEGMTVVENGREETVNYLKYIFNVV
jgi:hypothetical protein